MLGNGICKWRGFILKDWATYLKWNLTRRGRHLENIYWPGEWSLSIALTENNALRS